MQTVCDTLVLGEFHGRYPEVPLADGVDLPSLIADDPDPFFVTLPVAAVNAISENGRWYDADFVESLSRQIIERHPVGQMGHVADDERATAYPIAAAHWVGALRVGEVLWAKAYVPVGAVREFMRRMKATNSQIATSIYGTGEQIWDTERGAWRVLNFTLESIDFAPPQRAGVRMLAAVPVVTREMNTDTQAMIERLIQAMVLPEAPPTAPVLALRGVVQELVQTHNLTEPAAIREAIQAALSQPALQTLSQALLGPALRTPIGTRETAAPADGYLVPRPR